MAFHRRTDGGPTLHVGLVVNLLSSIYVEQINTTLEAFQKASLFDNPAKSIISSLSTLLRVLILLESGSTFPLLACQVLYRYMMKLSLQYHEIFQTSR